ncbi:MULTISPECIES: MFS transporter [unclassified Arthrobacter]|uniref:MFS transporter n=1 Tax=unclassified Arthrobacter TaxID=235627 RepID=UPI001491A4AC|nr:MFS transporter [Arthrobacter sp. AET 35A]MBE0010130.1 MFS transporter [Arthrobacter sp. AET 35A]NOJ64087.1 MFS transporter [Arthrobacter sp. 147(2020)]
MRKSRGAGSWSGTVVAAALITAATAPGQTAGLSPFTDPLIEQLDVSRTAISVSYLIGTLVGAAALPFIGRGVDRWGARTIITAAALVFAGTLLALSFATDIAGLTVGFVFLRMAGQGALTLAATTAVVKAITTRRGLALGITAAVGSAGISLTPVLVDRLISAGGIEMAWRYQAVAVLVVILPMVLLLPKHRKTSTAKPARSQAASHPNMVLGADWSSRQASRTPIFWAIAAALAATGMLTTGLAFHQISILTARGLTSTEAAANFIPQTVTGILATLVVGALSHRIDPRYALAGSMALLAAALGFLPLVDGIPSALLYGLVLGAAAGSIRAVEPIALSHYFGTENIGGIRGIITAINVGSTALGPIMFSLGRDLTGNYAVPGLIFAVLPLAVAVFALLCPVPGRNRKLMTRNRIQ